MPTDRLTERHDKADGVLFAIYAKQALKVNFLLHRHNTTHVRHNTNQSAVTGISIGIYCEKIRRVQSHYMC